MTSLPTVSPDETSLSVLLAEDSIFHQKLAAGMLVRKGHDVRVVQNGRQAVDAARREHFDLILMDVEMPVMDGLLATRQIRNLEQVGGGHVPIVAVTSTIDRESCLDAGMDGFLAKPLDNDELELLLRQVAAGAMA